VKRLVTILIVLLPLTVSAIELVRQKNAATYFTFPIVDVNGALVSSAAGLDSEYIDFSDANAPGTWADCTNEATEIGSTGWYYLSVAQAETNYDYVAFQVKSSDANNLTQNLLLRTMVGDPLNLMTTDDMNTPGEIADAVWDEAMSGHTDPNTYGGILFSTQLVVGIVSDANDANEFWVSTADDANDIYEGCNITVWDAGDDHGETRMIESYASDQELKVNLPFGFTPAVDDLVVIWSTNYTPLDLYEVISRLPYTTTVIDATGTQGSRPSSGTMTRYDLYGDDP
jgi:hypothetical protein